MRKKRDAKYGIKAKRYKGTIQEIQSSSNKRLQKQEQKMQVRK